MQPSFFAARFWISTEVEYEFSVAQINASTENAARTIGKTSLGRPPRPSHSCWALKWSISPASVLGGTPSAWWRSIPTRPAAGRYSPRRHVSSAVFRSIGMSPSFPHPWMVPLTDEMLNVVSSWSFRSSRHPWRNVFSVAGILTPLLGPHHVMGR